VRRATILLLALAGCGGGTSLAPTDQRIISAQLANCEEIAASLADAAGPNLARATVCVCAARGVMIHAGLDAGAVTAGCGQ
jgi:hypothetical protein